MVSVLLVVDAGSWSSCRTLAVLIAASSEDLDRKQQLVTGGSLVQAVMILMIVVGAGAWSSW